MDDESFSAVMRQSVIAHACLLPARGYIQLTEEKLKGTGFEAGDPITIEVRRGLILIYPSEE